MMGDGGPLLLPACPIGVQRKYLLPIGPSHRTPALYLQMQAVMLQP